MAGQGKETSAERRKAKAAEARAKAQAESRKRRIQVLAGGLAVALVAGGVFAGVAALTGDDDSDTASQDPAPSATPSAQPSADQSGVPAGKIRCLYLENANGTKAADVGRPPEIADAKGTVKVAMTLNKKPLELELDRSAAPCTVNSFVFLAKKKYFDDTPCHRLLDESQAGVTNAVLQCGDPTGTGTGGPGYKYADENLSGAKYAKGVIAMANAGPNTNGSQFFMMFKDSDFSPSYTPFGKILSGVDVIAKIAEGGRSANPQSGADDVPKTKTTINKITVEGGDDDSTSTAKPSASAKPTSTESPSTTPSSTSTAKP
ncbi:MAG: peptidylprolyl isomerase [Sporichthyaceae bacterium]